eukprot:symbB.v1.2.035729.t1/scaffold4881.1/size33497/2
MCSSYACGPILESIRTARSRPESFTDLVHQLPVEAAPSGTEASTGMEEELKLCLVLRADKEHQCDLRQVSGEESQLKKPHGYCYSLRRSLLRFRTQRLLLWVRTSNARVGRISDLLVSLIFFMLILSEVMALVILGTTFDRLDIEQAVWLWLLFPTLLAPCSPLMGLVALLMRQPWLCRLHSQLALMASINVAVVGSVYESQDGLLTPCVVLFVVHVVLCYFAAVYSGFEMSNLDLALAEDSGGDASLFSLRTAASSEDGICMALWPGRSTRARNRPHDAADIFSLDSFLPIKMSSHRIQDHPPLALAAIAADTRAPVAMKTFLWTNPFGHLYSCEEGDALPHQDSAVQRGRCLTNLSPQKDQLHLRWLQMVIFVVIE